MAGERTILTDEHRARLAPLLPPEKPATGRPAKPHREVLEAIGWVLRTGAPWRDLPPEYGRWQTAANRFYRWQRRPRPPARGRRKKEGDPAAEALEWSRGGFSTKIHVRAEGGGKPMVLLVSGGERHESQHVPALLERGAVTRPGRGAVTPPAAAGGGRQGLQLPHRPPASPPAWDRSGHPHALQPALPAML